MKIMPLGVNYATRELLRPPQDGAALADTLIEASPQNRERLRNVTQPGTLSPRQERKVKDLNDPLQAGWTFLVSSKHPQKGKLIRTVRELANRRKMKSPTEPLVFDGAPPEEWLEWISDNYLSLDADERPLYILILGGPQHVPFLFQSMLNTIARVGRLDFDTPQELEVYVKKLERLETEKEAVTNREAVFFAPVGKPGSDGSLDPTYFSHRYLAKPLAKEVEKQFGFKVTRLFEEKATKKNLKDALKQTNPALVFTASHGVGLPGQSLAEQKRLNGAICCEGWESVDEEDGLFRGQDVPDDEPWLEGAAVFQFACFGYGTPAQSDFAHWLPNDPSITQVNAKADFVAALPKKLLAHPRGPILFAGHVDLAMLHGFDDPANPFPDPDPWNPRIAPFKSALEALLKVSPMGSAMQDMSLRYNVLNASLSTRFDQLQRKALTLTAKLQEDTVDEWVWRGDAQNYLVFGDPAAYLSLP